MSRVSGRIFLSPPWIDHDIESKAVFDALVSNYIAPCGPMVDLFEREFTYVSGRKCTVALSSATAALDLLFHELGVSRGDRVFCSDLTFVASIAPACHRGAEPVFIDSDRSSWTMDPDLLGEALKDASRSGNLPKAVVAVDLYGQCCDYRRISNLCAAYEVPLIIDSAEAVGAKFEDVPAGGAGFAAVYSFNGNKMITTSGGGMLATDDEALSERIRKSSTQARESECWYEHRQLGFNYRLSNISAAIGVGQLRRLPLILKRKRCVFEEYKKALPDWQWMPEPEGRTHSRWLSTALVPGIRGRSRARPASKVLRLIEHLEKANVESRPIWKPMHLQPVFKGCTVYGGSVGEELFSRGICLPSGAGLDAVSQRRVVDLIGKFERSEGQ